MKPSDKDWIEHYQIILNNAYKTPEFNALLHQDFRNLAPDQKLYKLVQPSGLMYGHPIRPPGNYKLNMNNWNEAERMKFILLDCLINEALLFTPEKIETNKQFQEFIHHTIKMIFSFYQETIFVGSNILQGKQGEKSESDLVNNILDTRIQVKSKLTKNFWSGFFQNSLLFLDIYYFSQWLKTTKSNSVKNFIEVQENLRLTILQTIASAAWANDIIEEEEKTLFNFFLQSANLNPENQKIAKAMLNDVNRQDHLPKLTEEPWIIKKYILELAILTVWADRKVEETEKEYIKNLSTKLNISGTELDGSLLAIESFVISHWKQIHFLQSKHDMLIVKDRFTRRFMKIASKNKNAFVQEIQESKELMQLMFKMTREKLSEKEKRLVRAQLLDILKTLPTFVVIALPGTFITLPLLLKLLPKQAFPSAFSEID